LAKISIDNCCAHQTENRRRGVRGGSGGGERKRACVSAADDAGEPGAPGGEPAPEVGHPGDDTSDRRWMAEAAAAAAAAVGPEPGGPPETLLRREWNECHRRIGSGTPALGAGSRCGEVSPVSPEDPAAGRSDEQRVYFCIVAASINSTCIYFVFVFGIFFVVVFLMMMMMIWVTVVGLLVDQFLLS